MQLEFIGIDHEKFASVALDEINKYIKLEFKSKYADEWMNLGSQELLPELNILVSKDNKVFSSKLQFAYLAPDRQMHRNVMVYMPFKLRDFTAYNPLSMECKRDHLHIYHKYNQKSGTEIVRVLSKLPKFTIRRPSIIFRGFNKGQRKCQTT